MDYLLLGRIAKLVALIGFFLPWVTVSCAGTEILEATGLQLMTGDIETSGALAGVENQSAEKPQPNPYVIAACAALVLGLIAAMLSKGRTAAAIVLAGAVAGMGLSYYAVDNLRREMARSMNQTQQQSMPGAEKENSPFSAEQQNDMSRAMANAIKVEEQEGYWLTMSAAGVAAILGLVVLAGAGGVRRLDEPPPA